MFLLYSKPLWVFLLTWNKSRVVAVAHQNLPDLDPSGSLLSFPTTLPAASISAASASLLVVDTMSMIPPQGFCTGCSHHLEYPSTHICVVCSRTSFRSPNKFHLITEDFLKLFLSLLVILSSYLDFFIPILARISVITCL